MLQQIRQRTGAEFAFNRVLRNVQVVVEHENFVELRGEKIFEQEKFLVREIFSASAYGGVEIFQRIGGGGCKVFSQIARNALEYRDKIFAGRNFRQRALNVFFKHRRAVLKLPFRAASKR